MRLREALKLSWTNVWNHKLRSVLAILGVLIGVGAVIAIVTMTTGLERALLDTFTKDLLRADMISVTAQGGFAFFGPTQAFSKRDVERIREMPGVRAVDVIGRVQGDTLRFGDYRILESSVRVLTSPDVIPLEKGRSIQGKGEIIVGAHVAQEICERLLTLTANGTHGHDPEQIQKRCEHYEKEPALVERILAQKVRLQYLTASDAVKDEELQIVGLVKNSQFIRNTVSYVNLDYHSDSETIDGQRVSVYTGVIVRVADVNQVGQIAQKLEDYFKSAQADARKILGTQKKVEISTLEGVIDDIRTEIGKFTAFMGAIAGVALLVGMIGVMNVMLITVKERTREIGVMKATGATSGSVLKLFLTEAALICTVGAAVGVGLGMLGSLGVIQAMAAVFELKEIPFVFVWNWYVVAIIAGLVVGIVSGVYPAWQAARVHPIEALRYE